MINTFANRDFKFSMVSNIMTLFPSSSRDVHYIGGCDILPAPLEPYEESAMVAGLGNGDDQEIKKILIERNLRLVVYIAKKFDNTGIGVEDLISIGTIGLIKAINTFKCDKNIKLATYASRCIEMKSLCISAGTANSAWRFRLMNH